MAVKDDKEKTKNTGKPEKEETVTLSKTAVEQMMKRMERLEAAADRGRLSVFDSKNQKKGPNIFLLSVTEVDGEKKIITGWRTLKNKSYKDPRTRGLVEEQEYEVMFHDNSKPLKVYGYLEFSDMRYNETIRVEEVERTGQDEKMTITVKVTDPDSDFFGEELVMDPAFLN